MVVVNGKNNWFEFSNGVFPFPVFMFIGSREDMIRTASCGFTGCQNPIKECDASSLRSEMDRLFKEQPNTAPGECISLETEGGVKVFVVRVSKFKGSAESTAILAHECLHAALDVLGHSGVSENAPNETLCYLHEAIFRKFVKDAFEWAGLMFDSASDFSNAMKKARCRK